MSTHTFRTRRIRQAFKDDAALQVLLDAIDRGPFDGGGLIVAKALQVALGEGELVRITSNLNDNQTEHYGIRVPTGGIYDAAGGYESSLQWIGTFAQLEHVHDRRLSFAEGFDDCASAEIPDDPVAVKQLAQVLMTWLDPWLPNRPILGIPQDELQAIHAAFQIWGRRVKGLIRAAWFDGDYARYLGHADKIDHAALQRFRNSEHGGPVGLKQIPMKRLQRNRDGTIRLSPL